MPIVLTSLLLAFSCQRRAAPRGQAPRRSTASAPTHTLVTMDVPSPAPVSQVLLDAAIVDALTDPCVTPQAPPGWSGADPTMDPNTPTVVDRDLDHDGTPDLLITGRGNCDQHTNCLYNVYLMRGPCGLWRGRVVTSGGETLDSPGPRHAGMDDLVSTVDTVYRLHSGGIIHGMIDRRYEVDHGRYVLRLVRFEDDDNVWRPPHSNEQ